MAERLVQRVEDVRDGDAARVVRLDDPVAVREEVAHEAQLRDGWRRRVLAEDLGGDVVPRFRHETRVGRLEAHVPVQRGFDVRAVPALRVE